MVIILFACPRAVTVSVTTASVRRVISTVRDTDTEGVMVSPARYLIQYTY